MGLEQNIDFHNYRVNILLKKIRFNLNKNEKMGYNLTIANCRIKLCFLISLHVIYTLKCFRQGDNSTGKVLASKHRT